MDQAFGRRASTVEARFLPRPVHVRFLVETMALVRGSFRVHRFSPVITIPPVMDTHLHLHVTVTRRTKGRSLWNFQKSLLFRKSGSIGWKSTDTLFLSERRSVLDHIRILVKFIPYKLVQWWIFLLVLRFFLVSIIPPILHTRLHLHVTLTRTTWDRSRLTFKKAVLFWKSGSICLQITSTFFFFCKGCTVSLAVERQILIDEGWVRALTSPCCICGGQNDTGADFSPNTLIFLCQYVIPHIFHTKSTFTLAFDSMKLEKLEKLRKIMLSPLSLSIKKGKQIHYLSSLSCQKFAVSHGGNIFRSAFHWLLLGLALVTFITRPGLA